jgi:hypothetical protein
MAKENVTPVDDVVEAAPAPISGDYVIVDGDTYAALGETFKSGKETGFEKANAIYAANKGKALIPGETLSI